jgi:hypothetical protein
MRLSNLGWNDYFTTGNFIRWCNYRRFAQEMDVHLRFRYLEIRSYLRLPFNLSFWAPTNNLLDFGVTPLLTISFLLCTVKTLWTPPTCVLFVRLRAPFVPFPLFLTPWRDLRPSQRNVVIHRPVLTIPPSGGSYFANLRCRSPPHREMVWTRVYEELFRSLLISSRTSDEGTGDEGLYSSLPIWTQKMKNFTSKGSKVSSLWGVGGS